MGNATADLSELRHRLLHEQCKKVRDAEAIAVLRRAIARAERTQLAALESELGDRAERDVHDFPPAECGTEEGWAQHMRRWRTEKVCDACRAAHREPSRGELSRTFNIMYRRLTE